MRLGQKRDSSRDSLPAGRDVAPVECGEDVVDRVKRREPLRRVDVLESDLEAFVRAGWKKSREDAALEGTIAGRYGKDAAKKKLRLDPKTTMVKLTRSWRGASSTTCSR